MKTIHRLVTGLFVAGALLAGSHTGAAEIHDAAGKGDVARVTALLTANPGLVSVRNESLGYTPLHSAADRGRKDVVELLLAHHAEVNARDNDGWTPLHAAARYDNKDVVELLLARQAEVNVGDTVGQTPLHQAAIKGSKAAVELLLARQAEVNARTKAGVTPLALALHSRQAIESNWAGARRMNTNQSQDKDAALKACDETIALLRQHGGKE